MENKKQTLLRSNNATYKDVNGITYFKLKSEFNGDYTKNCGLLGEEIDENFYFLRGYDIEKMYVDSDRNLVIERIDKDYEPIKIKLDEELGKDTFRFDKETGTIYITYSDGTVAKMDGFLVAGKDIRMATDSTIDGDGTLFNPLRISSVDVTGTYGPADEYFDITESKKMPDGKGKGYRIVTKEIIDKFGCLYSLEEMKSIQKDLEKKFSQWRVPTKQDWDELLNAMETDPEYRNHTSKSNKWLGQVAGSALKSYNLWKEYEPIKTDEIPVKGQDIAAMSILPLGIGPDRNEILNDDDFDLEGFEKLSGFWTSTEDGSGNNYVKIFGYSTAKVDQDTYGEGARLSLRLVKEYNYDNYNAVEEILGLPYTTRIINGVCNDYQKIWTDINVYSYNYGVRSEEWNKIDDRGIKIVYFINEWDGLKWHKKLMKEADSVVIKQYEDKPNHEWRIINGELIDTLEDIMNAFDEALTELNGKIDAEIERATSAETVLHEIIDAEIKRATSAETALHERIDEEVYELKKAISDEAKLREEGDKQINERIDEEVSKLEEADNKLHEAILREAEIRAKADNELHERIDEEVSKLEEADKKLGERIDAETDRAISAETTLQANIDAETNRALSAETALQANIDAETDRATSAETALHERIDEEAINRYNNDIKPGTYTIDSDPEKEITIPTNGEDIADIKIKLSSDFFNFGKII